MSRANHNPNRLTSSPSSSSNERERERENGKWRTPKSREAEHRIQRLGKRERERKRGRGRERQATYAKETQGRTHKSTAERKEEKKERERERERETRAQTMVQLTNECLPNQAIELPQISFLHHLTRLRTTLTGCALQVPDGTQASLWRTHTASAWPLFKINNSNTINPNHARRRDETDDTAQTEGEGPSNRAGARRQKKGRYKPGRRHDGQDSYCKWIL